MLRKMLVAALLVLAGASETLAQGYNPPWVANVQGTNTPGLENTPLFLWNNFGGSTFDTRPTIRADRNVGTVGGGGQPWYTYKTIWGLTTTGYAEQGFEWSVVGELHNRTRKSAGAQNVAVNGTAWKDKTDNGEETGTTWAGNFNCVDNTGVANPTTSCIALELDLGGVVGADVNRQRVLSHAAGGGQDGAHIGYGYMVSTGPGVTIDRAFSTANVGSTFGIGLDLAGASFSGAAINLAPYQFLAFDGNAAGSFGRFMFYDGGGSLYYMTPYGPMLQFTDDGAAKVGRVIEKIPHVPSSINSPCETGEHAWDANFEYRCISTNRWRRSALSDW